ncbi:MAG: NAD-dependent epimerase/dehydratase family protein [Candidatus Pacebacteria bacterium]|nr:NAD-dependent epimerase/dehydratase family protein [Candidatus Paceibacterota bacterium]
MTSPKTILVTGCAGFIGSNFVNKFLKEFPKTKVIGIDDLSSGRKDSINKKITFYEKSILDEEALKDIFSKHKPEYVFHFAALPRVSFSVKYPVKTTEANVVGTVALLETAKTYGVKRFIYSSSSSVYGGAKQMPTKESDNFPDPKSPYATQKYVGEVFCRNFSAISNLDTVCLRYFTVFGPGQYGDDAYITVIAAWLESLYFPNNKKGFVEGNGLQSRDFCYIDNVVDANILAMKSSKKFGGDIFNVAHGERTTLNEVRKLIEKHTGKKLDLEKRPTRSADVKHTHADISKAKKVLGYKPKFNFEQGLKKTIDWFESR